MREFSKTAVRWGWLVTCVLGVTAVGQMRPGEEGRKVEDIRIVQPVVDKEAGTVTLPGAFWNEGLADWVEVGVCGRPSDFLHETVVAVTTTRQVLEDALRAAGFHDADHWVTTVKDFPRVRGDRLMVLLKFTREGKEEEYSLDELIGYQGWGTSAGPYGFMFKGDPGGARKAATKPAAGGGGGEGGAEPMSDATKILRDDPQIALVFKGIQSMSQSFADQPLAYDDWVYPMMNFGRNTAALPAKVFNSNGEIPVTVALRKVTEEAFLRESARVWHDAGWREQILKMVPVAQQIDKDKAAMWQSLMREATIDANRELIDRMHAERRKLAAAIEKGYATLDAAWATYGADHARFMTDDPKIAAMLKEEAGRWREHMVLLQRRAEQLAIAEEATVELQLRAAGAEDVSIRPIRGREIEARSKALLAENKQPRDRWKDEAARLDPKTDPRIDWLKVVALQVEIAEAREEMGTSGVQYGQRLQVAVVDEGNVAPSAASYAWAGVRVKLAELRLSLADTNFEIGKREGLENDPELPRLREKKKQLEAEIGQLTAAGAVTQPATMRY